MSERATLEDWAQNAFGILLVIQAGWKGEGENEKADKLEDFLKTAPRGTQAVGALTVLQQLANRPR